MGRWWKERRITRLRREHAELVRRGAAAIAAWRGVESRPVLRLERAQLAKADLAGADLSRARLERATLDGANLAGADLTDAVLRHASLRHANLADVRGLTPAQLAGCDLTGAVLPPPIDLKELADGAKLGEAAGYTRHLFLWMIGCSAFCAMTIAGMPMCQLLMSGGQVKLPVLGAAVPTFVFFCAAPALLLGVFYYFHLSLQRLWEKLALLPAIFPDGEPIDRKTHGWLMFGLVRRHLPQLRERPAMFHMQSAIHVTIAYGLTPVTVLLIWWRYSLRHDWNRSILHALAAAVSIFLAIGFYAIATGTLRGKKRRILLWSRYGVAVGVLFGLQAIMEASFLGEGLAGFNAVIVDEGFSERPAGWRARRSALDRDYLATLDNESPRRQFLRVAAGGEQTPLKDYLEDYDAAYGSLKGASLARVNLVNGQLYGCFLAHADLAFAQWHRLQAWDVDLSYAVLNNAVLENASLLESWLVGASFVDANLSHATLIGVSAMAADFRGAFAYGLDATGTVDLRQAQFDRATLTEAKLAGALLRGASFAHADCCHAQFVGSELENASFAGADLRGASFEKARLAHADFTGAKLGVDAYTDGQPRGAPTSFCGADLSETQGLTREQLRLVTTDWATQLPRYLLALPRRDFPAVVVLPKLGNDATVAVASADDDVTPTAEQSVDDPPRPAAPGSAVADDSFNPLRPGRIRR